jgi:hypothetical protein
VSDSSSCSGVACGTPASAFALSPIPMPRNARPPDSSSRVAMAFAVTKGLRVIGFVTDVPSATRSVASAHAARVTYVSR